MRLCVLQCVANITTFVSLNTQHVANDTKQAQTNPISDSD